VLAYARADPVWLEGWVSLQRIRLALVSHGSGLERYVQGTGWRRIATSPAGGLFEKSAPLPEPAR
jgi:hypothetical protein